MHPRSVQVFVTAVLAASALAVVYNVYAFGQRRFFTVDEYQYGHATWLVSQADVPYLDFYEHHFPLSYVLHAPFVSGDASFPDRALRLRLISLVYILAASLLLGWATYRVTRDPLAALLAVLIPPSVGFGLMSAVDYRADNFGAFLFLACMALLEVNRANAGLGTARRWLAPLCGVLLALSLLMTQKMVVLAGGSVAVWLLLDVFRRRGSARVGRFRGVLAGEAFVVHPMAFCLGAGATLLLFLAFGAQQGLLGRAVLSHLIEVADRSAHEDVVPASHVQRRRCDL